MASTLQAIIGANTCTFSTRRSSLKQQKISKRSSCMFIVRASSSDDNDDCNEEECAPEKEVGKVSMEWLAEEKTKVVGTYPPRRKQGWTGYVEKDTAGQTNIYSVEPAVYVAESAISSGTAGSSSDGAQNTAAIAAGLALISIAAASSILLQVNKNTPPVVQTLEYSGPSLSYYINAFKPPEITQAPATPIETEIAPPVESQTPEITQATATPIETEISPPVQPQTSEITQASATPIETEISPPVQPQSTETDASISVQPESSPAEVSQVQVEPQVQPETSSEDDWTLYFKY